MNFTIKLLILIAVGLFIFQACAKSTKTLETPADVADAIRKNNTAAISLWLKNGGNPNEKIEGQSLLYISTGPKGGYEMTKLLIENGADVNKGAGQYTPLMNAASWVSLKSVKLLLDYNADKTLLNGEGKSAVGLIGDCEGCPREKEIKLLLK